MVKQNLVFWRKITLLCVFASVVCALTFFHVSWTHTAYANRYVYLCLLSVRLPFSMSHVRTQRMLTGMCICVCGLDSQTPLVWIMYVRISLVAEEYELTPLMALPLCWTFWRAINDKEKQQGFIISVQLCSYSIVSALPCRVLARISKLPVQTQRWFQNNPSNPFWD